MLARLISVDMQGKVTRSWGSRDQPQPLPAFGVARSKSNQNAQWGRNAVFLQRRYIIAPAPGVVFADYSNAMLGAGVAGAS